MYVVRQRSWGHVEAALDDGGIIVARDSVRSLFIPVVRVTRIDSLLLMIVIWDVSTERRRKVRMYYIFHI